MKFNVKLPESCLESVQQEGRQIRLSKAFAPLPETVLPHGGILLQAKVTDSFHFVDHPTVELDPSGETVSRFHCDCPDWRLERRFCAHCAALVLAPEDSFLHMSASAEACELPVAADAPASEESPQPRLTDLSYAFCNSAWDLYPRVKEPRIPLERYIQVFGDNARARSIYRIAGAWGGSCFGMVATSSLLYQPDGGIETADFHPEARIPSQLSLSNRSEALGMTLHAFIEAMHILQYTGLVSSEVNRYLNDPNCMETLAQRVAAFQQGENAPVCMCVWRTPAMDGGHAIFPYRLEKVSETEDVLHIYDPNWPMVTRYAYLEKDRTGRYLDWRFPMNDRKVYSSKSGGHLSLNTYETYKKAWDRRSASAGNNLLNVQAGVAVLDGLGAVLAQVTAEGVRSYREDIFQIPVLFGPSHGSVTLSLPAGSYTVRLEDPEQDSLSVHLAGTDLSVTLNTTAREAAVCVTDEDMTAFVRIAEPGAHYDIAFLNTAGQTHEDTQVDGVTGQEALFLLQRDHRLYGAGLTDRTSLYINEAPASLECIGRLIEETPLQDPEAELVTNAALSEKPEDPQA